VTGLGTVVQVRLGSTRLPGKALKLLAGRPMLGRVLDRHRQMRHCGALIVATTQRAQDDPLQAFCDQEGLACWRGSEADVLERYCQAAAAFELEHVIRSCGDNPLFDPGLGDELVELYLAEGADYATSKSADVDSNLPDGAGLEIFGRRALEGSAARGHQPHHREHVNEYILEHPEQFRIAVLKKPQLLAGRGKGLRLTVDTPADLERVDRIYAHFAGRLQEMTLEAVIDFCLRTGAL